MAVSLSCWLRNEKSLDPESRIGLWDYGKLCAKKRSAFPTVPQPLLLFSINRNAHQKKKPKTDVASLDIHIAVDRAARLHSTFAGANDDENAVPPLRSNELLCCVSGYLAGPS